MPRGGPRGPLSRNKRVSPASDAKQGRQRESQCRQTTQASRPPPDDLGPAILLKPIRWMLIALCVVTLPGLLTLSSWCRPSRASQSTLMQYLRSPSSWFRCGGSSGSAGCCWRCGAGRRIAVGSTGSVERGARTRRRRRSLSRCSRLDRVAPRAAVRPMFHQRGPIALYFGISCRSTVPRLGGSRAAVALNSDRPLSTVGIVEHDHRSCNLLCPIASSTGSYRLSARIPSISMCTWPRSTLSSQLQASRRSSKHVPKSMQIWTPSG